MRLIPIFDNTETHTNTDNKETHTNTTRFTNGSTKRIYHFLYSNLNDDITKWSITFQTPVSN